MTILHPGADEEGKLRISDLVGSIDANRAAAIPAPTATGMGTLFVRRWGERFFVVQVNEHGAFVDNGLRDRYSITNHLRRAIEAGESVTVDPLHSVWPAYHDVPASARDGGDR